MTEPPTTEGAARPIADQQAEPTDGRVVADGGSLAQSGVRLPATDADRRALASVLRLRILRMCRYEPLTNKEIAVRLGRNPASVLHHVRTLVAQGFLVVSEERRGPRGSREVPYSATGKSWNLDFGQRDVDSTLLRAFFEEVAQVPEGDVTTIRLGLQLSPENYEQLMSRMQALLDEFARRELDPGGLRKSLFVAIHPEL